MTILQGFRARSSGAWNQVQTRLSERQQTERRLVLRCCHKRSRQINYHWAGQGGRRQKPTTTSGGTPLKIKYLCYTHFYYAAASGAPEGSQMYSTVWSS